MSLQFIIGRAGSGKSTLLYKNLIDTSMNNPDKNILAVVPEQFSMETQKPVSYTHLDVYKRQTLFMVPL